MPRLIARGYVTSPRVSVGCHCVARSVRFIRNEWNPVALKLAAASFHVSNLGACSGVMGKDILWCNFCFGLAFLAAFWCIMEVAVGVPLQLMPVNQNQLKQKLPREPTWQYNMEHTEPIGHISLVLLLCRWLKYAGYPNDVMFEFIHVQIFMDISPSLALQQKYTTMKCPQFTRTFSSSQLTYNYIYNYGQLWLLLLLLLLLYYYYIYIYINTMDIVRQLVFWTIYDMFVHWRVYGHVGDLSGCSHGAHLCEDLWSQQGARFPFGSPSLKTWKTQWWGGGWEERHGMESHGGGRRNMYKIIMIIMNRSDRYYI